MIGGTISTRTSNIDTTSYWQRATHLSFGALRRASPRKSSPVCRNACYPQRLRMRAKVECDQGLPFFVSKPAASIVAAMSRRLSPFSRSCRMNAKPCCSASSGTNCRGSFFLPCSWPAPVELFHVLS